MGRLTKLLLGGSCAAAAGLLAWIALKDYRIREEVCTGSADDEGETCCGAYPGECAPCMREACQKERCAGCTFPDAAPYEGKRKENGGPCTDEYWDQEVAEEYGWDAVPVGEGGA